MNSFASASHTRQTPTPLPFSRLRAPAEDLYPRLFDAILEQRIDSASRFTEDSLKEMFGASRADVRRVLTQLSHEHVIVLRANHRPRVAAPDRGADTAGSACAAPDRKHAGASGLSAPAGRRFETPARADRARASGRRAGSAGGGDSLVRGVSSAVGANGGECTVGAFSRQSGAADVIGDCAK